MLRAMERCSFLLSLLCLTALTQACVGNNNGNNSGQPPPMDTTMTSIEVNTADGVHPLTMADLEALKANLIEVLSEKKPEQDYGFLIGELRDHSAPMISEDGVARIGGWRLTEISGRPVFERQQMPRAPMMRFFHAPIAWDEKGRWRITDVIIVKVRGR